MPGKIALLVCPEMIGKLRSQAKLGVLAVSGSAGKSTTTKLMVRALEAHGLRVFSNASTANIEQGLASSLVREASLWGRLECDVWVLELDEAHAAKLAPILAPDVTVLTNLMTDQLDRFDDPEEVLQKLQLLAANSGAVVVNSNDPFLSALEIKTPFGFSADEKLLRAPDAPELAPYFGEPAAKQIPVALTFSRPAEHEIVIQHEGAAHRLKPQLSGTHNAFNLAGAWLAVAVFLGARCDAAKLLTAIESTPPVFARDERLKIGGNQVRLVLVQNPSSFRLNLRRLGRPDSPLMIAIGSDVHDPSWIWSIDFSQFSRVELVSGSNSSQLALWLRYQGIPVGAVEPDVSRAADKFLDLLKGSSGTVVLTADAMRRFRRHLRLAK